MRDVTGRNFGLLIAYVLPGFVTLWGLGRDVPAVREWLTAAVTAESLAPPSVGGFLYATVASVLAGLTVSTLRWVVIDWLHHRTGIPRPRWNDARLQANLEAFEALVEAHYRYYQFYANMVVTLCLVLAAGLLRSGRCLSQVTLPECGLLVLTVLYWAGSRNTLRNYYRRAAYLLGTAESEVQGDERTRHARRWEAGQTADDQAAGE